MGYGYENLAYDVLKDVEHPLIYQDIWERAMQLGLTKKLGPTGKTPWQSLGSRLYIEVRDNPASRFIAVGNRPKRFFLKERQHQLPPDIVSKLDAQELQAAANNGRTKKAGSERDLHPLLAYFAYANPAFNRGRRIHTKTIYHERSVKSGYSEWTHPDMVGFHLPFDEWQPNVIEFNRVADNNALRLYSFELKRALNKANYREAYFQAVSNSSWAHEGYLVAADVLDDDDFRAELERLAASFGIGVVSLDAEDVDSSQVLFPARTRDSLDWETINKLCEQNPDFAKFLRDVKIDFDAREIHSSKYDQVNQVGAEH